MLKGNAMPEGAIIIDRAYFDKPEWLNQSKNGGFDRGRAWLDLLAITNQTATTAAVRGIQLPIERGECAYSKLGLATRWGRSQNWVSATLAAWEADGRIQIRKSDNETTVLFLVNFDSWQTGMFKSLCESNGEQMESKSRASGEQKETEKEKEKDTDTEPRGEGEGEGEEDRSLRLPELPSDAALIAFGAQFPGEPATGAPGPMATEWVTAFIKRINGRREFPRDWKRLMIASWRDEWRSARSENAVLPKKSPPVSASVTAISLGQELAALERDLEQDRQTNQPRDPKKTARVRQLRAELEQLKG